MGYIVDISKWQDPSKIDYDTFCKQLDMAIIRVQYGSLKIDPCYTQHIAEMQKHKVPYGVYAFVRGISIADMAQEARDFYCRAKDYNPAFYALDVEEQSMQDMRGGVSTYIAELRKYIGNKKVGVYIAHNHYKDFNLDLTKADFIWIPRYGVNNGTVSSTPVFYCDLHQYTSTGHIDGYSGNLDLNRLMNGRTVEFFTGVKPIPKPTNIPAYYIAQPGDTLSEIASRFNIAGGYVALAKLNGIKDPDKIYPGQKIKLHGSVAAHQAPAPVKHTYYTVVKGDSLWKIAEDYNTTVDNLARLNNIVNPSLIYPGQKIIIR